MYNNVVIIFICKENFIPFQSILDSKKFLCHIIVIILKHHVHAKRIKSEDTQSEYLGTENLNVDNISALT